MILSTPGGYRNFPEHDAPRLGGILSSDNGGEAGGQRWGRALRLSVTRPEPGIVIVRISGEIDLSSVPRLSELIQQRLTAALLRGVVLDLSGVSFCDSSGLELLLEVKHRAGRRGITLHVIVGNSAVRQLLDLTGLSSWFVCHDSATEAISDLRR